MAKTKVAIRDGKPLRPTGDPFDRAVEAIYDAAAVPAKWPEALQAIADQFGDLGAVLMWRRDDGVFGTIVSPALEAAQKDYVENKWYLRDLPAQRVVDHGFLNKLGTANDRDFVTGEEMATEPFYTEFSARHGIRWRMGIAVVPDPSIAVWVALQRGPDKQPHSDAERKIAATLGRHVERSLRLSIRLFDAELTSLGLGDALMRLGVGVLTLDSLGRIVFSNSAGRSLLGDRINPVDGVLRIGAGALQESLNARISEAVQGGERPRSFESRPILLPRKDAARPIAIYLLPVTSGAQATEQFLTQTRAIMLAIDPKADDPADPTLVRDVLGLTLGEARVAALVGVGIPPRDAAIKLGIAEETARSILKRVFSKVGVSRQSELSALLTKLVLR